jgi:methionyl-tRNA synthetase
MGKDNVTFHTIIFPSTLLGTNQKFTLVHHLSTTDYLNYEDKKFSKSMGTGVFGDDASNTGISSEVWRYYLLVNRPEQSDAIFKWSDLALKNNSELLAKLGNLCNRVLKFSYSKFDKKNPSVDTQNVLKDEDIAKFFKTTHDYVKKYTSTLEQVRIKEGLKLVIELSEEGNKFFQDLKPWDLFKSNPER